jgi:hypothetical protein
MKAKLLLLSSLLLAGCNPEVTIEIQRRDVTNLPKAFSILEQLQVQAYRNQDWCKNIFYKGGKYSNNNEATTCNLFDGKAKAFDSQTERDFKAVEGTINSTNVRLHYFSAEYEKAGKLIQADFDLAQCPCSYTYSPNYTKLPEDIPNEMEYSAVNKDWYFVKRDWN